MNARRRRVLLLPLLPLLPLLLLALAGAQALALMHAVLHAQPAAHGPAAAAPLQDLFALHDDETDCRLYDGVSAQPFACPPPAALPQAAPSLLVLRVLQGDFVARRAALFEARGPPLSR